MTVSVLCSRLTTQTTWRVNCQHDTLLRSQRDCGTWAAYRLLPVVRTAVFWYRLRVDSDCFGTDYILVYTTCRHCLRVSTDYMLVPATF